VLAGIHLQIDAGPDLRRQCLDHNIRQVDEVIITHGHADHMMGMDDLRRFCTLRGSTALNVYSNPLGIKRITSAFDYAVREVPEYQYYPAFRLREMPEVLDLPGGRVRSTPLPHGAIETLGLVFEEDSTGTRAAYYTDCKSLTPEALRLASGADVLILDALQPYHHAAHHSLPEAINSARKVAAKRTWFTHMNYHLDHEATNERLPADMQLAHDGLRINLTGLS